MMMTSWTSATDASQSIPLDTLWGMYIFSHRGQDLQRVRWDRRADGRVGGRLAQAAPLGDGLGAGERDPVRDLRRLRPHRALRRQARAPLLRPPPRAEEGLGPQG